MHGSPTKTVLVTGGSRGIGRAIAVRLGSEGLTVVVNCRRATDDAERVVAEVVEAGGTCIAIAGDVTTPVGAASLVAAAEERVGPLDILVNNVGDFVLKRLSDTQPEEWDAIIASNLSSAFYVSYAALPSMRERQYGRIVNIGLAPMHKVRGAANLAPYAIAKAGIAILTRSMAGEEAGMNITVNCVAPGLIDNGHLSDEEAKWMSDRVPMGRLGRVSEVAAAVAFLVSSEATYISGAVLAVSGGWDWEGRPYASYDRATMPSAFTPVAKVADERL